jgi:eukaryotic-like serine/threonine-protein kinase
MANVYVGRGVSDDGTEELVALKVIRDEYGNDPRFLRMFSDEARILERISHPHVIRTLEYGIERNHRYIVMELLAGRTLHEAWELLCERGQRLPLTLGAWICARVAEGLHCAHELTDTSGLPLGIVHRDVNPTNIFLTHAGEVKLIDFGLAKARVRRHQTQGGMVKGKIPYLAPEQLELRPVDRRIDVFGLGTTLWEMGTMRRLFKRATDLETLTAVRDQVVPDPRTIVPEYPEALARIVANALRRDPDERYATANAFRMDLDAFVARSDVEMKRELGSLMAKLFPGEWSAYATWLDESIAVPIATVAPPPMSVPVASSKLLDPEVEVGEAEISIPGIRVPDFES